MSGAPLLTNTREHAPAPPPRRRRRPQGVRGFEVNITPMIDVVFLLLTYFLLLAQLSPREAAIAARPAAPHSSAAAPGPAPDPFELPKLPIVLEVRSTGDGPAQCSIRTDDPTLAGSAGFEDLASRASGARGTLWRPEQSFVIRAAADSRWEHALATLNALKRAGYDQVTFAPPAP